MGDNLLAEMSLGEGRPLWLYPVGIKYIGNSSFGGGRLADGMVYCCGVFRE
jgi:hypothetical protein